MKVSVEHFGGRVEEYTIPSPQEIQAFKDGLQPIVEFFTQDPPAPSFNQADGFIEELPPSDEPEPGEIKRTGRIGGEVSRCAAGKAESPDEYFVVEPAEVGTVLTDRPVCFLCGTIIESDDSYCYGCRTFLCPDHPQTPWGHHDPEAHDEP